MPLPRLFPPLRVWPWAILTAALVHLGYSALLSSPPEPRVRPGDAWLWCAPSVAHGLGGIDSLLYTNSRDAFLTNYARGFRAFEADLRWTRDSALVLAHDWSTPARLPFTEPPTLAAFRSARVYGRYAPLTFTDLLDLLAQHPDAHVLLDLKHGPQAMAPAVRRAVRDPRQLAQLAPLVWSDADARVLRGLADWPLVYSLHFTTSPDDAVLETVTRYGVGAVVAHRFRWHRGLATRLSAVGVAHYLSLVNTGPEARFHRGRGVQGLVTDFLPPDTFCPTTPGL